MGSNQLLIEGLEEGETTILVWKRDGTRLTYRVGAKAGGEPVPVPFHLAPSDIMAVIVENKAMIKACVGEAKARDPGATGTIVMRWTILPSGRVSNVQTMTQEFRKGPLAACLAEGIKKLRFPAYGGPLMSPVNFPFKF